LANGQNSQYYKALEILDSVVPAGRIYTVADMAKDPITRLENIQTIQMQDGSKWIAGVIPNCRTPIY
jgi:hypothetical protein